MAFAGAIAVPHPPLIVEAVGRGEERRIQTTIDAYRRAARELLKRAPECLVVTSPHAPLFRDAFHVTTDAHLIGDMARFGAPDERIDAVCDTEFAREIMRQASKANIPTVDSDRYRDGMDHGTYVPLYFVRKAAREMRLGPSSPSKSGERGAAPDLPCPIVRIALSGLSPETHRELGRCIARAADALGRRVGFIASGDFSHKLLTEGPYGFAPEGPVFDTRISEIFASGDLEGLFGFDEKFCEAAAECGLRSFQIMAGAIDGLGWDVELLSHEGPFGVGYGVATCFPQKEERPMPSSDASIEEVGEPPEREPSGVEAHGGEDPYVALARLSVETFVTTGMPAEVPQTLAPELAERRAGVFVSLHKDGELRGCIGTIAPATSSIAEEIVRNGIAACSEDPRFRPVAPDELGDLDYSVDVLGAPEPIASPEELDPSRYGVIVTKGWRRGLLLPDLEGVDAVDIQLRIAKQKAGIDPCDDDVALERFEVVRHVARPS